MQNVAATPQSEEAPPLEVRPPRWWTLIVWTILWSVVAFEFYHPSHGIINWYTTVAWTLPFGVGLIGLYGATVSRPIIKRQPLTREDVGMVNDPLHVFITTKGENQVLGALTRVIHSMPHFATHFTNHTVYIVTEFGCEAMAVIEALAAEVGAKIVVVPQGYQTQNRSRFKARASCYALAKLIEFYGGEDKIPADCWTYRLDDDTSIWECTVRKLAEFVKNNPASNPDSKHLAQGILTYRRQNSTSLLMWLADAIRTADDLFRFPATTGRGTPRAGMHGENMLVRTRNEAAIGWDFGPKEIVEDSRFAILFGERFPGACAWITARVFGAPPINSAQFAGIQRPRWAEGMWGLAFGRSVPLRDRALIIHNMLVWATGIFQPVLVVAFVSFMVGDFNVAPITPWLAPVWVISVAYTYWAYWEGLRQNALASGRKSASIWHKLLLIPGIVWFSLLEGYGGTYGVVRYFTKREKTFENVAKPA